MSALRHFLEAGIGERIWGRLRLRRCLLRAAQLVRRHLSRHRPGTDRRHDRESSTGLLWKLFMSVPEVQTGPAPARLHQPAPRRRRTAADGSAFTRFRTMARRGVPPRRRGDAGERFAGRHRQEPSRASDRPIRPVKGSIVASPVLAAYDPDPDYFFHWFRDSAVVIDAVRLLHRGTAISVAEALRAFRRLRAVQSRRCSNLDGRS